MHRNDICQPQNAEGKDRTAAHTDRDIRTVFDMPRGTQIEDCFLSAAVYNSRKRALTF